MSFFGKVFLLAAFVGYSYLLFQDPIMGKNFDSKYNEFQKHTLVTQYVPKEVFAHVPAVLARQVVAGLLASSVLVFVCGCFAIFPILGLVIQMAVVSNPLFYQDQQTQINFLKSLALIGGVLLWAASGCAKKSSEKVKKE